MMKLLSFILLIGLAVNLQAMKPAETKEKKVEERKPKSCTGDSCVAWLASWFAEPKSDDTRVISCIGDRCMMGPKIMG